MTPRTILVAGLLGLTFWLLYMAAGAQITQTRAADYYDIAFGGDTPRVIRDMTRADYVHHRTLTHPLFVLLFNSWASALARLVDSEKSVAVVLTALFSAAGPACCFLLLRRHGAALRRAVLLSLTAGFSASYAVFGGFPETMVMAAAGMGVVLLAATTPWPLWLRTGIAVVATGINLALLAVAVLGELVLVSAGSQHQRLRRTVVFGTVTVALVLGGAMLQSSVHQNARPLFQQDPAESDYLYEPDDFSEAGAWALQSLQASLAWSALGGELEWRASRPGAPKLLQIDPARSWLRSPARVGAAALWFALLALSAWSFWQRPESRTPLAWFLLIVVTCHIVLFTFYGISDPFLFTPLVILPLIVWIGLAMQRTPLSRRTVDAGLAILNALLLVNSTLFFREVVAQLR